MRWAISAFTLRAHAYGTEYIHRVNLCNAPDRLGAIDLAMAWLLELHPASDGWEEHNVLAYGIDDDPQSLQDPTNPVDNTLRDLINGIS